MARERMFKKLGGSIKANLVKPLDSGSVEIFEASHVGKDVFNDDDIVLALS